MTSRFPTPNDYDYEYRFAEHEHEMRGSSLAGSSAIYVATVQGEGFGGIAAMSDVGIRASADKLERVLRRQKLPEDTKHPRRIAD